MAFGKITKEDLKEAGLDPDKLAELTAKGVTKEDLATLKTELGTSLSASVTELIKNSFTELETKLTGRNTNTEGNQNTNTNRETNQNTNKDMFSEIDPTEFALDPGAQLKRIAGAIVSGNAIQNMGLRRDMAYQTALNTLKGFKNDALKAEIDTEWAKYTPEALVRLNADPLNTLIKVHDSILGAHFEDIQRDTSKREGKFNLIQSGGSSGGNGTNTNKNTEKAEDVLSPEEIATAAQFGMKPEEWLAEKKQIRYS